MEKRCPKCAQTLPLSAFGKNKAKCLGVTDYCKSCMRVLQTKTYRRWIGMKSRCFNPREPNFENYGGRGITVCHEWRESYAVFLADMGECPAGMTLDRIDVNGNYEPGNCRWATPVEQGNNRRNNRLLTYGGKTRTIAQWTSELGFPDTILLNRLRRGWDVARALTTPPEQRYQR